MSFKPKRYVIRGKVSARDEIAFGRFRSHRVIGARVLICLVLRADQEKATSPPFDSVSPQKLCWLMIEPIWALPGGENIWIDRKWKRALRRRGPLMGYTGKVACTARKRGRDRDGRIAWEETREIGGEKIDRPRLGLAGRRQTVALRCLKYGLPTRKTLCSALLTRYL